MKGIPVLMAFVIVSSIILYGCEYKIQREYTLEDSKEIAELFVRNSPTYAYDGSKIRMLHSAELRCDNCLVFVFEFMSSHPGYGDRSDKMTAEARTKHIIDVIVSKGQVIQATIDNEWDEIKQRGAIDYERIDIESLTRIPMYLCTGTRPANCNPETEPVCSSDNKDYTNGCLACSKETTKWYTKGECRRGYTERVIKDLGQGKVTKDSGPFLVVVAWNMIGQ